MSKNYEVSLFVTVRDERAALAAGARELVRSKSVRTYTEGVAEIDGDVQKALRFLFDPGNDPDLYPGIEITDSGCIEEGTR